MNGKRSNGEKFNNPQTYDQKIERIRGLIRDTSLTNAGIAKLFKGVLPATVEYIRNEMGKP